MCLFCLSQCYGSDLSVFLRLSCWNFCNQSWYVMASLWNRVSGRVYGHDKGIHSQGMFVGTVLYKPLDFLWEKLVCWCSITLWECRVKVPVAVGVYHHSKKSQQRPQIFDECLWVLYSLNHRTFCDHTCYGHASYTTRWNIMQIAGLLLSRCE